MCGIAGVFSYRGSASPVDAAELVRMREAMRSRGPDGAGVWLSADCRVGMSHRRLAIIDLSDAGAQPMTDEHGLTIVFNGEIYNYRELRAELEREGCRFRSMSDTEVIIQLYRTFGEGFARKLRGMFAFAIWDPHKNRLVLGRDPFGIKPLYYADDGDSIRFASQVKALMAGGRISAEPDPAGVAGFYVWGHVPEPYTIFRGVRSVPAGALMHFESGHAPITRQFQTVIESCDSWDVPLPTDSGLHDALLDAVRAHMIADVPVGAFLSAGIDSSVLCALALEAGAADLRTVTLGFREYEGSPEDEVPLAEATADFLGTHHESRWVRKEDFEDDLPRILEAMDQPTVDGINTYFVSKVAAQSGLKVALSGIGGDELFGGYPSFAQIPELVNWVSKLPSPEVIGKLVRQLAAPFLKRITSPKYASLLEYGDTFEGAFLLRRGLFMPWELPSFMDSEFARVGWEELNTLKRLGDTASSHCNEHCRVTALETAWYMQSRILRDTDWAGMAHSLEIRTPLVDATLWRAVGPRLCSKAGLNKAILAASPSVRLPTKVLAREKSGFNVPIRDWLLDSQHSASNERGLRGWGRFIANRFEIA